MLTRRSRPPALVEGASSSELGKASGVSRGKETIPQGGWLWGFFLVCRFLLVVCHKSRYRVWGNQDMLSYHILSGCTFSVKFSSCND